MQKSAVCFALYFAFYMYICMIVQRSMGKTEQMFRKSHSNMQ